jgi:energy-coupling factor transporter transmembrane protein EcfT
MLAFVMGYMIGAYIYILFSCGLDRRWIVTGFFFGLLLWFFLLHILGVDLRYHEGDKRPWEEWQGFIF